MIAYLSALLFEKRGEAKEKKTEKRPMSQVALGISPPVFAKEARKY